MSTLPKSIQAAQGPDSDSLSDVAALQDKRRACRELANKYKRLPDDFLRIPSSYYPANELQDDPNLAMVVHQQALGLVGPDVAAAGGSSGGPGGQLVDMVDISCVEAQLVKNYGLLRMDLYCKIRVGHMVCETQTCPNGAKNPKWDGVYQFSLKPGIDSFHLEIYDEKQFSLDEKIAWLHEPLPKEIFRGITVERWFPLSGRLGQHKEGSVLLVISHKRAPRRASHLMRSIHPHHQMPPGAGPIYMAGPNAHQMMPGPTSVVPVVDPVAVPMAGYMGPPPAPQPQQTYQAEQRQQAPDANMQAQMREPAAEVRPASEEDINQLSEMFPSIDKQIIKAVLENNQHVKEASISALLAMA